MRRDLRWLPIVVTGASSGIGRATALACARAGMPVVAAARRKPRVDALIAEIKAAGGRATGIECDVANADDCRRAVERCIEAFGSVYAVFANAGYGVGAPMHLMSDADLRRIFEVNFFGTMGIIRPALERMIPAGRGHVLVCSSCLSLFSMPAYGAYCATKAAQHRVAGSMRLELAPLGVQVTSVHPIGTQTEFFEAADKAGGSGSKPIRTPKLFMQSSEFVAGKIVACLRRPKAQVWPGLGGKAVRVLMAAAQMAPNLTDAVVRIGTGRVHRGGAESAQNES